MAKKIDIFKDLFQGLEEKDIARVCAVCVKVEFPSDIIIYANGILNRKLYIIKEGRVELETPSRDGKVISSLGEGQMFGELGFLASLGEDKEWPRNSTATVKEPTTMFVVKAEEWYELSKTFPQVYVKLCSMAIATLLERLKGKDIPD